MSEEESVIVRTRLKDKIKSRIDLRSGKEAVNDLIDILDGIAIKMIDACGDSAREGGRKTVLARDVVKAKRVVLENTVPEVESLVKLIASLSAEDLLELAEALRERKKEKTQ